jgi:hypothetical protein
MTLATILTQIISAVPLAVPTSFVGNVDETAVLALQMAQDAGEALARKPQGGWVAMILEYDFTTAALQNQPGTIANTGPGGTAQITLPGGPAAVAAFTWYGFGTGVPNNSIVQSIVGNVITLNQAASTTGAGTFTFGQSDYPAPPAFQRPLDNTMWDRSRFWSMRGPQSPQQWQLYKSSVIGRATIQRRFRFRQINGNLVFSIDPVPTDNGSSLVFEYVSNAWCKSSGGTPQTSWLADTDVGILDEYLLRLGAKWRLLRRLGMSYSEELDEYEREVSRAMATDGGAAILSIVPVDNNLTLIGPWNLPETNFGGVTG